MAHSPQTIMSLHSKDKRHITHKNSKVKQRTLGNNTVQIKKIHTREQQRPDKQTRLGSNSPDKQTPLGNNTVQTNNPHKQTRQGKNTLQ